MDLPRVRCCPTRGLQQFASERQAVASRGGCAATEGQGRRTEGRTKYCWRHRIPVTLRPPASTTRASEPQSLPALASPELIGRSDDGKLSAIVRAAIVLLRSAPLIMLRPHIPARFSRPPHEPQLARAERRATGVYYTPPEIVRQIVDLTLGPLFLAPNRRASSTPPAAPASFWSRPIAVLSEQYGRADCQSLTLWDRHRRRQPLRPRRERLPDLHPRNLFVADALASEHIEASFLRRRSRQSALRQHPPTRQVPLARAHRRAAAAIPRGPRQF